MTSRLASLLVQDGRVSAKRMADAFQRQVIFGGTLDTILLEMGLVEVGVLLSYLSRATGLPLCDEPPAPEAHDAVGAGFGVPLAERFHALPIGRGSDGRLRVMLLDVPEREDTAALEQALGRPVQPFVAPEYRFHLAAERLFDIPLPPRFSKLVTRLDEGGVRSMPIARGPSLFGGRGGSRSLTPPAFAPPLPPVATLRSLPPLPGRRPTPAYGVSGAAPSAAAPHPQAPPPLAVVISPLRAPAAGRAGSEAARPSSTVSGLPPVPRVEWPSADALDAATPALLPPAAPAPLFAATAPPVAVAPIADERAAPPPMDPGLLAPSPAPPEEPPRPPALEPARLEDHVLPHPVLSALEQGEAPDLRQARSAATRLLVSDGLEALQTATDRDTVFEVLCRMARRRFAFAAIFVVQREAATLTMALETAFYDRASLRQAEVPLSEPSPLRAVSLSRSPFIGAIGDDPVLSRVLALLGRRPPVWGALLPIVLRDRCVAVLHVDDGEQVVSGDDLSELVQATAEAAVAFRRIIQVNKDQRAPGASAAPEARPPRPERRPTPFASVGFGDPGPRVTDLPPAAAPAAALDPVAIDKLIRIAESDDPATSPAAAGMLAAAGAVAARGVAERFPGVLRFNHRKLHAISLPLAEHGPLLALAARLGTPMVAPLVERLGDPQADVRFYAALVLAEVRAESSVLPLSYHLFDPDLAVRRASAFALSRQPPSPALGRLLDQLREELSGDDLSRQRSAVAALGELRDGAAVPRLVDLLTHRDTEMVDLAHRALVVISKQDFGTARWRWRSWWERARTQSRAEWLLAGLEQASPEARRSAIEELQVIGVDRLGCHARLSRRERDETARRYAEWRQRHPEVVDEQRS